jgi:hypothetical protein
MRSTWKLLALSVFVTAAATSCAGKGDNGGADRALISNTAGKALSRLQESVAMLGRAQLAEPIEGRMSPYLVAMREVAQSFPDAAGGKREVINTLTYVGMGLATANAAQAVGGIALTGPYTSESRVLDELLKSAEKEKVKDFKPDELTEETSRLLALLGEITILGNKELTDKIVPADSPLRANWDKNQDGKFEVPLPPVDMPGGGQDWQGFTTDLTFERERGSLVGRMVLEISFHAARLQLRLS